MGWLDTQCTGCQGILRVSHAADGPGIALREEVADGQRPADVARLVQLG